MGLITEKLLSVVFLMAALSVSFVSKGQTTPPPPANLRIQVQNCGFGFTALRWDAPAPGGSYVYQVEKYAAGPGGIFNWFIQNSKLPPFGPTQTGTSFADIGSGGKLNKYRVQAISGGISSTYAYISSDCRSLGAWQSASFTFDSEEWETESPGVLYSDVEGATATATFTGRYFRIAFPAQEVDSLSLITIAVDGQQVNDVFPLSTSSTMVYDYAGTSLSPTAVHTVVVTLVSGELVMGAIEFNSSASGARNAPATADDLSIPDANLSSDLTTSLDEISVYPNPITSYTDVMLSEDFRGVVNFTLTDISGQKIFTEQRKVAFHESTQTLNLPIGDMQNGIYHLMIQSGENTEVIKLIK